MFKHRFGGRMMVACLLLAMANVAGAAAKPKPKPAPPPEPSAPTGLLIPVPLEKVANFKVAGKLLADGAWPPANTTIDNIPFQPIKGDNDALDVSTSMSGFKGGKIKSAYLSPEAGQGPKAKGPPKEMYGRLLMKVPADTYSALHVLAFSQEKEGTVPRMTVRIGRFGNASALLADSVADVPKINSNVDPTKPSTKPAGLDAEVVSRIPVKLPGGGAGFVFHVRIPTPHTANLREFCDDSRNRLFDLELTRDLNVHMPVPDPSEFTMVPAGQPSGVVVLAATLERSPIDMTYSSTEPGNVFQEGQQAKFDVNLTNRSDQAMDVFLTGESVGPGTPEENGGKMPQSAATSSLVEIPPHATRTMDLHVSPQKRGWYALNIKVSQSNGIVWQSRRTSYALLAPDTRKDTAESPFGVWCFWNAHSATGADPNRNDKLASLMHKGGWRWTYGGHPAAPNAAGAKRGSKESAEAAEAEIKRIRDKYNVTMTVQSPPNGYQRGTGWWDPAGFEKDVIPWLKHMQTSGQDNAYKVLHESRSSSALLLRLSEFLGGQPYDMPPEEKEKLDKQFEAVKQYCLAIKKADPQAKIVLINDQPPVAVEYMKRKFPAEAFDVFGSEGANFMREPERQPDWLSLLGTLQQLKRAQKQYGYDKPIWFTEALYHGTNPGNLSLHQQGVVAVREAMLALANGVERMTSAGLVADSADDYHWSNWGACGFCFRDPEYNPKPSYAMYAWLTQVLDGHKYAGKISNNEGNESTALHILDFKQRNGEGHVYPIWVPRGRQAAKLAVWSGTPVVYDVYGNVIPGKLEGGFLTVEASATPIYVTGATIHRVAGRRPVDVDLLDDDQNPALIRLDEGNACRRVEKPSAILERNWNQPRVYGDFLVRHEDIALPRGLIVELRDDKDSRKLIPRYVELEVTKPVELPRQAKALTAHVKGYGGWGRIMFECVDAKGRIWTSCGNQHPGAANATDCHGDSYISFDGWGTVRQPLPGQYPGKDQQVLWPRNSEWWPTNLPSRPATAPATAPVTGNRKAGADLPRGDDPVDLPLKLTKVIVEMRPNILYVDEERPVAQRSIWIDAIGVETAEPK